MAKEIYSSSLSSWRIKEQKIIVKTDLNVPMKNGMIQDDTKLQMLSTTLDYLIAQQSIPVVVTHMGRPTHYDRNLSTETLLPWFMEKKYSIIFAATLEEAYQKIQYISPGTILMLENMRFFPGEHNRDLSFACALRKLGTFYLHDGFSCMHTHDTSNVILPTLFDREHKTISPNATQELNMLYSITHNPCRPFVVILGGAKLKTKIAYIKSFLTAADTLIICPALVFTFLKAEGLEVGSSLIDDSLIHDAATIMSIAKSNNDALVFPCDIQIKCTDFDYSIVPVHRIPKNAYGISIGPQTITDIEPIMRNAGTILYNGTMGFLEEDETLTGIKQLLDTIALSSAKTLIAGGDTTAAVHRFGMQKQFTHLSIGGGSTLHYTLYHDLPALQSIYSFR